jgi:hypothetical protein
MHDSGSAAEDAASGEDTRSAAPIAARAHAPHPSRYWLWLGAPLLAACAALAVIVLREQAPASRAAQDLAAPRLGYFIQRGDALIRGDGTGTVHPGDALRFVYSSDRDYYLAIMSADARGVGVYFPSGSVAELVRAGEEVTLDFSVELDATLGRERVTALFCPEAFNVDDLQSALSSGAVQLAALARCQRVAFELNKQPAR